jgi:hypothetical protein
MPRPDSPIIRPSSHFKKLTYKQVCSLLQLLEQVNSSANEEDRLDNEEKEARIALLEIKSAMEDKRAAEDLAAKEKKRAK